MLALDAVHADKRTKQFRQYDNVSNHTANDMLRAPELVRFWHFQQPVMRQQEAPGSKKYVATTCNKPQPGKISHVGELSLGHATADHNATCFRVERH